MRAETFMFLFILSIWIFATVLFRQLKLDFFRFITGSLGFFAITMIFFREPLEFILVNSLCYILNLIGNTTEWFKVVLEYAILIIEGKQGGILNISITYQCSGVIELAVFTCLALFFPFLSNYKKVYVVIVGNLYLFACNIIRILFIVASVKLFGVQVYEFSHMILARILFFLLTIVLYYRVFTRNQLKNQKVGEVT